jgi:hypothetical protein
VRWAQKLACLNGKVWAVHRVVTKWMDHHGKWITEVGPWLSSYGTAEDWADNFRRMGYRVTLQSISGDNPGGMGDFDLNDALANMA